MRARIISTQGQRRQIEPALGARASQRPHCYHKLRQAASLYSRLGAAYSLHAVSLGVGTSS